jgi:hypothetical protein
MSNHIQAKVIPICCITGQLSQTKEDEDFEGLSPGLDQKRYSKI